MDIRPAAISDLEAINAIYNYFVERSNATFDTRLRSTEDARRWLQEHAALAHPALVADDGGVVKGWASLSRMSAKAAYDTSAEVSVYVSWEHHRRGIGSRLLQAALDAASASGLHCVIARIAGDNHASIRLFGALGFDHVGVEREVGWKFGRFQDVVVMQRLFRHNVPSG